jgi:glutathione S-transferase
MSGQELPLTLYDSRLSGNAWKVRLLLSQLGRPFKRVTFDLPQGKTRTPEFLAKNPVGKIPVIEMADGTTLFESNAILAFLARGTRFIPDDPLDQARMLQWLFFEQTEAVKNLAPPRFVIAIAKKGQERAAEIAKWHEGGYRALAILDARLASRPFLVGDRYSIADIANYPYVSMAHEGEFDVEQFRHVQSWLDRVRSEPGYVPLVQD